MDLSHRNGIKMITYSWPTASGPAGFEWARRYPHLISHGKVGPGPDAFDLEISGCTTSSTRARN